MVGRQVGSVAHVYHGRRLASFVPSRRPLEADLHQTTLIQIEFVRTRQFGATSKAGRRAY